MSQRERVCQHPDCDASLEHMKSNARWCSGSCSRDARRKRALAGNGDTTQMVYVRGYYRKKPGKTPADAR